MLNLLGVGHITAYAQALSPLLAYLSGELLNFVSCAGGDGNVCSCLSKGKGNAATNTAPRRGKLRRSIYESQSHNHS